MSSNGTRLPGHGTLSNIAPGKDPSVKGAHELVDPSYHRVDGVTGQPISARRRRDAAANEAFYGVIYADADDLLGEIGDTDNEGEAPRHHGYGYV